MHKTSKSESNVKVHLHTASPIELETPTLQRTAVLYVDAEMKGACTYSYHN